MSTKRRKVTDMQQLMPQEQDELIQRYQHRKDVRAANRRLATLVLSWASGTILTEEQFMEQFERGGHSGQYHENPSDTTYNRVQARIAELKNIKERLSDTPLDYMGAIELSYVYERIQRMLDLLDIIPDGTMDDAIDLYTAIGESIRDKVYQETGHWPEQFPIPHGRITGREPVHHFKLMPYQAPLLTSPEKE